MAAAVESRLVELADREMALQFLSRDAVANLLLLDLAARLGTPPAPGETPTKIVAAWRDDEIVGMAGLHPTVILDANASEEVVEAFVPFIERIRIGLVKLNSLIEAAIWRTCFCECVRALRTYGINSSIPRHSRSRPLISTQSFAVPRPGR